MHRTRTSGPRTGAHDGAEAARLRPGPLTALGLFATLLLAGAWWLPLWQARLLAPQYPGGLLTTAYGNKVTGDLDEINALNHYVGLGVFDPSDVPEMRLWPLAVAAALVAILVALLLRGRWPARLAVLYLWMLPVGVLADIQFRLHQFGQDVTPGAAFRMEPFTPWVIGRTTVWNFETWAWPGWGLAAVTAAAAVVTFGPRLLERLPAGAGAGRSLAITALTVSVALSGFGAFTAPGYATEAHDHGSHDRGAPDPSPHAPPAPAVGPSDHPVAPRVVDHPEAGPLAPLVAGTEPGGRLLLSPGTYTGPIVIDEPIVLEGEGLPIVQGDGTGSVITVRAPGTTIRGVVVRGSGAGPNDNPAGIRIEADDVTIEGVVVEDSYMGLAVDSARAVKLLDNHIHGRANAAILDEGHAAHGEDPTTRSEDADASHAGSGHDASDHGPTGDHEVGEHGEHTPSATKVPDAHRGDGVWLHDVDHVLVRGNHVSHVRDGVYVSFGSGAILDGNHVHHSRYAVHSMFARDLAVVQNHFAHNLSGLVLMYGSDVLLLRNHIEGNLSPSTGFGIILKDIVEVELVQNILVDNRIGLHLDGPAEATATANTVARHDVAVQAHSSASATFSANSFAQNTIQVLPLGSGFPDVAWGAKGWGNFWDTYRGYDARGEGRGAIPHVEGGAVDRLLGRSPELVAIAGRPAMRLLRSVEERWGQHEPALTDELPLTAPVSPALAAPAPDPAARRLGLLAGAALTLPTGLLLLRRRPVSIKRRVRHALAA